MNTPVIKTRKPTRFGRALRRLYEKKTTHVVYHIALKLEADGLVTIHQAPTSAGSRSALPCLLTAAGELAAQSALEGKNPYALKSPQKKQPRRFRPAKEKPLR